MQAAPHLWWYLARATGLVAWALLAASVIWGVMVSTRLARGIATPAWFTDLHRFLGGLASVFTAFHIGGLVADTYVSFGLRDVVVPFASRWHPTAVAWGVIAMYLLVAVEMTSLLKRWLPTRWWRRVHASSFALYWTATAHLVFAGTDALAPSTVLMVDAVSAVVLFLTLVRVLAPRRQSGSAQRHSPSSTRPTLEEAAA